MTKRSKQIRDAIRRVHRGGRVADVRDALGMTGEDFARLIEQTLRTLGVGGHYDKAKLSRIEGGVRDLSIEEAAAIALHDPRRPFDESMRWLAFGTLDFSNLPKVTPADNG